MQAVSSIACHCKLDRFTEYCINFFQRQMQSGYNVIATFWKTIQMYIFFKHNCKLWLMWQPYSWSGLISVTNFFVAFNLAILGFHKPHWSSFHPLLLSSNVPGSGVERNEEFDPLGAESPCLLKLTVSWHIQGNFSPCRNHFPSCLKLFSILLGKMNSTFLWGSRGQSGCCQKTALHTLENVKWTSVWPERLKFGRIGRCARSSSPRAESSGGRRRRVLMWAVCRCTVLATAWHSIPTEKMCAPVKRTDRYDLVLGTEPHDTTLETKSLAVIL